jgi:myo-inositol 2-dehydrogenase / D-chiro-inositol 1-dehydrogenase
VTHPESQPVRVGVLGCGVIAYWVHLRLLQNLPGAKLVAASDPDPDARARARTLMRAPVVEDSQQLLENDDIDAVVICAPTHLHADLATAACKAGKHVFLEKPIATNAADSLRVVNAAEEAGVSTMLGFNRRFHPMFEQARAMIASGELGRVRAVQTAFCEPMPLTEMAQWRRSRSTGGGVLLDLASHHVDLLRWFLDDEIEFADATISSDVSDHDSATVALSLRRGAQVQSFFSYRTGRADFVEFIGEKATLRVDRHEPTFKLKVGRRFGYGTRTRHVVPSRSVAAWRVQRLVRPFRDPSYRRALGAFVGSIRGAAPSLASFSDGARSLDVILAAEASAKAHAPARVPG